MVANGMRNRGRVAWVETPVRARGGQRRAATCPCRNLSIYLVSSPCAPRARRGRPTPHVVM